MFKVLTSSLFAATLVLACQSTLREKSQRSDTCLREQSICSPHDAPARIDVSRDSANETSKLLGLYHGDVLRFVNEHQRLPESLKDASTTDKPALDAWGRPVRYTSLYAAYEIRSAGSDALFQTLDDVYFVSHLTRTRPCILVVAGRRFDYSDGDPLCAPLLQGIPA
jgi:hypothetical protein